MENTDKSLGRPPKWKMDTKTGDLFGDANSLVSDSYEDSDFDNGLESVGNQATVCGGGEGGESEASGGSGRGSEEDRVLLEELKRLGTEAESESVRVQAIVKYDQIAARMDARAGSRDEIPGELRAFLDLLLVGDSARACVKSV